MTYDGKSLIKSDGTNILYFLDPQTGAEKSSVAVYDENGPVDRLNELEFIDGTRVRDIKFDSKDPEFALDLKNVSKLIRLLKLEVMLEDLNNPNINLDLDFINDINGSMVKISEKWGCLDNESLKILGFEEL